MGASDCLVVTPTAMRVSTAATACGWTAAARAGMELAHAAVMMLIYVGI